MIDSRRGTLGAADHAPARTQERCCSLIEVSDITPISYVEQYHSKQYSSRRVMSHRHSSFFVLPHARLLQRALKSDDMP